MATAIGVAVTKGAVEQERPELQAAAQAWVDAGFVGMQLRVHDERGEWAGSAGVRKLGATAKPPTNGRFWAGSIAKTFTATVVLRWPRARVGLDDPVRGYLPECGLDPRITMRMLHTSGLANYTDQCYPDGMFVPGMPVTGQDYASTNFTLAVLLIEKVAPSHLYEEEMKRRILRPLKLRGTVVAGARPQLFGLHAHGYYRYQDAGQVKVVDVSRKNLSLLAGAGDALFTTRDLRTLISALMSGKFVPPPLLAETRARRTALPELLATVFCEGRTAG